MLLTITECKLNNDFWSEFLKEVALIICFG